MSEKESKSSVRNEQFSESEDTQEKHSTQSQKVMTAMKKTETDKSVKTEKKTTKPKSAKVVSVGNIEKQLKTPKKKKSEKKKPKSDIDKPAKDPTIDKTSVTGKKKLAKTKKTATVKKNEITAEDPLKTQEGSILVIAEKSTKKEQKPEHLIKDTKKKTTKAIEGVEQSDHENTESLLHKPEKIDYLKLSKEDLIKVLKDIINQQSGEDIRKDVDIIKSLFYKKQKAEIEEKRQKFLEEGGQLQDFKVEINPMEQELKELLTKFRDIRHEYNKKNDEEKTDNLTQKYKIIEAIKELVNSQESLNKTFQEFRELQNRWRELGPVPQQSLKDLWESYHYHVEAFYDYIKINKELRDLDLKKNLESKIHLCEKAEELLLESSVVEAFRNLQKLHNQWREIGPVLIEKRSAIWERFKEATAKINKKHQEYFVNLKQDQKLNYEEKLLLCEKAEAILAIELNNHKDWEEKSKELVELQKIWKTIGFAPKKFNTTVFERFRKACDQFFESKRQYYSQNREEQNNNMQLKTELCIQAEALQNSNDWKKTTDDLIALQKKWKEIGPVSAKQSEKIWKRFRSACDKFFNNKSAFFSQIDTHYENNLALKNQLIEEIEKFVPDSNVEQNLNALNDFQRRWSEIGFVPIKNKTEIQDRYREAINNKFDELRIDDDKKDLLKFKNRIESLVSKPNSHQRLLNERDKYFNKLKQLESDIILWENNIGFFADSKNAESMIADVKQKIQNAQTKIIQLKNRLDILDQMDE